MLQLAFCTQQHSSFIRLSNNVSVNEPSMTAEPSKITSKAEWDNFNEDTAFRKENNIGSARSMERARIAEKAGPRLSRRCR